ncbi:hypothetical protein KC19_5G129800 [Ceratodon purpureus]|uniref:Uncharacterized protein n=1 Tax=Ceratodon purpureus TaxID=3225 RepID=A0A8T0I0U2_CERPU|nr:hypothetical protein KC19_N026200 [Ceratodon purpureus]KAG0577090.1 hypothetical protein KC19_5G129800 [Ceratodon purpureus]
MSLFIQQPKYKTSARLLKNTAQNPSPHISIRGIFQNGKTTTTYIKSKPKSATASVNFRPFYHASQMSPPHSSQKNYNPKQHPTRQITGSKPKPQLIRVNPNSQTSSKTPSPRPSNPQIISITEFPHLAITTNPTA